MDSHEQMVRDALERQPVGISPVFCLEPEIVDSLERVAPEKFEEIRPHMRPIHFEYHNPKFVFSTSGRHITVSAGALNLVWCATYAYWLVYQQFVQSQKDGLETVDLGRDPDTVAALNLYEWALRSVAVEKAESWPDGAPRPNRHPDYASPLHVANEIFLVAIGWMLLHEVGHIAGQHPLVSVPDQSKQLEHEADDFATKHILDGISDGAVLLKRALGIAVTSVVLLMGDISLRSSVLLTHPLSEERLSRNLRNWLPDSHPVHAFVTTMLQIHMAKFGVPHQLGDHEHFSSFVDDFCLALSRSRK
jgi:hypothetical protein